jgi:hypothetical protein
MDARCSQSSGSRQSPDPLPLYTHSTLCTRQPRRRRLYMRRRRGIQLLVPVAAVTEVATAAATVAGTAAAATTAASSEGGGGEGGDDGGGEGGGGEGAAAREAAAREAAAREATARAEEAMRVAETEAAATEAAATEVAATEEAATAAAAMGAAAMEAAAMGARWLRRRRRWRRQRRRRQRRWRQRRRRRRRRRRHRPALSSHLPSQHDHCSVSVGAGTMRVQAWGWQHATLCYTHAEWMCSAASGSALLVGRVGRCSKGRRRRLHSLLLLASSLPGDHARPSGLLGWRGSPPNMWLGVPGRSRPLTGTLTGTLTGSHYCHDRAGGGKMGAVVVSNSRFAPEAHGAVGRHLGAAGTSRTPRRGKGVSRRRF